VQHLATLRASKVQALTSKIEDDVVAGNLPAATDAVALARFTMGVLTGLAQSARDGVCRAELERVAQIAVRAWG